MAKVDDDTFFIGMILLFTHDEQQREDMVTRMCEQDGHEREKVEAVLDALHKMYRKDPLDVSEPDPELVLAFARRIAKISGKSVEQVLAEGDALGRQGRVLF